MVGRQFQERRRAVQVAAPECALRLQALARRLRAGVSGRVLADLAGAAPHTLLGAEVAAGLVRRDLGIPA